jgi:hypothetical protein
VERSTSGMSEQVTERLTPYLGPFNARVWVKAVAQRELGLLPEELNAGHLAALVDGLRPSLRTIMGRSAADELLLQIGREVG